MACMILLLKSIIRYFPPNATAGLATSAVRTPNLLPCPPASSIAIISFLITSFTPRLSVSMLYLMLYMIITYCYFIKQQFSHFFKQFIYFACLLSTICLILRFFSLFYPGKKDVYAYFLFFSVFFN